MLFGFITKLPSIDELIARIGIHADWSFEFIQSAGACFYLDMDINVAVKYVLFQLICCNEIRQIN